MKRKSGFSLVELLVVVAILTALLGVLLPALGHAREVARDVRCRTNQSAVYKGQYAYSVDQGQWTSLWSESDQSSWRHKLGAYTGTGTSSPMDAVFQCPDVKPHELDEYPTDSDIGQFPGSFGLNGAMQFREWSSRSEAPPNPAQIIALGEQPVDILEALLTGDGYGVWTNGTHTNWFAASNHDITRSIRHVWPTAANFTMMDGHVRPLEIHELARDGGHWYWWNALANDTASAPGDGAGPSWSMGGTDKPSPTAVAPGIGGGVPTGPLRAPCGCPLLP